LIGGEVLRGKHSRCGLGYGDMLEVVTLVT